MSKIYHVPNSKYDCERHMDGSVVIYITHSNGKGRVEVARFDATQWIFIEAHTSDFTDRPAELRMALGAAEHLHMGGHRR